MQIISDFARNGYIFAQYVVDTSNKPNIDYLQ